MTTLFGQRIEPDFDLPKEQRRDRIGWVIYGGLALCLVYLFSGRPFATEVFQGMFATVFPYGVSFYVNQKSNQLDKLWLWKAVLASLPVHILYLMGVFWSDKEFPEFMTKVVVFLPVLAVGGAIESIFLDRLRISSPAQPTSRLHRWRKSDLGLGLWSLWVPHARFVSVGLFLTMDLS